MHMGVAKSSTTMLKIEEIELTRSRIQRPAVIATRMDCTGQHRRGASTAVSAPFCLATCKWVKDEPETRMSPAAGGAVEP